MRQLTTMFIIILISILLSCTSNKVDSEFSSDKISIGMVVSDIEKSIAFYTTVIGMQIVEEIKIDTVFGKKSGLSDGKEFTIKLLKLTDNEDAPELKLMSFKSRRDKPFPKFIHDDTGIQYLTIFVNSMAPFLDRIKNNRIEMLGDTPLIIMGDKQFVCIQDPDGTFIELIGPK